MRRGESWFALRIGAVAFLLVAPQTLRAGEPAPTNDRCRDAEPLAVPSSTMGQTETATNDDAPTCGPAANTSAGVWYKVTGNGNRFTAETCNANTNFDTEISVFCDDCDDLPCIAGNDDFCSLQSRIGWCTQPGVTYLILVHGFDSAKGNFELEVTDGDPCNDAFPCEFTGVPVVSHAGLGLLFVALILGGLAILRLRRLRSST